jgi:dTDP-4-amino-4,6-dideoxygalactose transaminase
MSEAVARVLAHGRYINGPEVTAFEEALAADVGVAHVIGCSSGTDALVLLLMAAGIGPGDAVIVPALTFIATAEAVVLAGATPVFADVRPSDATLCPDSARAAIAALRAAGGPVPRAIIAVDLFSLPADHRALSALCAEEGLRLFYDAAHSIGTDTPDGACGSYGDGAATSFYPSKALGCYGDGGAVLTRDAELAARVRLIVNHGNAGAAGHTLIGLNARLDTIQAAILIEKLSVFRAETARRRAIAARYRAELASVCAVPRVPPGVDPVWSYFCITHPDRNGLQAELAARGIGTVAYYATPSPRQPAYRDFPIAPGGIPQTERLAATLLCLPLHPYMTEAEVDRVIAGVTDFGRGAA